MLDKWVTDSEILLDNYDVLYCDRNRNIGGVAYYIRSDWSYTPSNLFHNDIENVFFEIHLPKINQLNVGIFYWPSNKPNFIKTLKENFVKLDRTNSKS